MSEVKGKKEKGKNKDLMSLATPLLKMDLLSTFYFCLFAFAFLLTPLAASAQDDEPIPPPPIIVTKEERQKLDAQTDTKERIKLSLDLMNARLTVAEKFSTDQDFESMFRELGGFHGLLDNAMERLERQSGSDRKVLDNYKRFSLGIRGFATRLEVIRRDMPLQYEDYVRKLLIHIRDLQTKAAEPFFKDTVVPNQKP